jgi:hypothetical protein
VKYIEANEYAYKLYGTTDARQEQTFSYDNYISSRLSGLTDTSHSCACACCRKEEEESNSRSRTSNEQENTNNTDRVRLLFVVIG